MTTTVKIMFASNKLFSNSYYCHYKCEQNYLCCIKKIEHIPRMSINKHTKFEITMLNTILLKIPQKCALFSVCQTRETP